MKQLQNQTEAFSQGTPVWVIADLAHSRWAKKLDWYLNFQLRKASLHQSKKISQTERTKIESWGVTLSTRQIQTDAPLLIATHKLLPNQLTLQIPFKDLTEWIEVTVRILQNLKIETARIFLPKGIRASELAQLTKTNIQFEIVEEAALV